uniref:D-aspartate oxidase-like isoform X2 n=1 Tax=Myxine glutinosa TaxID=7769 RepID=UPI00358EAB03
MQDVVRVTVVGAGVVGCATALQIKEKLLNATVSIVAAHTSPDTTSNVAADTPLSSQRQWFRDTFSHFLRLINDHHAGVRLINGYQLYNSTQDQVPFWGGDVFGFRAITDKELAMFPGCSHGFHLTTLQCDVATYLAYLMLRLNALGVNIIEKHLSDLFELEGQADVVVLCTGVGSAHLISDPDLYPVRGQIVNVYAPGIHSFVRIGDGMTHIYPGAGGMVTLGGIKAVGDGDLRVRDSETRDILTRCFTVMPFLKNVIGDSKNDKFAIKDEKRHSLCDSGCTKNTWGRDRETGWRIGVGLRPFRKQLRLDRLWLRGSQGKRMRLVTCYGHGGGGISLHWGSATEAADRVLDWAHDPEGKGVQDAWPANRIPAKL